MKKQRGKLVYLTDKFVAEAEAHISIVNAGIVMGATVTEMTRTFKQKPYKLKDHIDRLYRSVKYARLGKLPLEKEEMVNITEELAAHNAPLEGKGVQMGIIHFITPGVFEKYVGAAAALGEESTPTICIHTFPLRFYLFRKAFLGGYHAITPPTRHIPPQCLEPKMKYRSRLHWWIADQEVKEINPEAVTLLLDLDGNITETSGANFMLAKDGTIYSPTTRNILPGIARKTAIGLAYRLGIPMVERDLQLYDAITADEAFLTTTPICIGACTRINGIPIGDGKPGPIFEKLLDAWSKEVGVDIRRQVLDYPVPQE